MLQKKSILFISVLIVIGVGFLFLRTSLKVIPSSVSPGGTPLDAEQTAVNAELAEMYPLTLKANRLVYLKQPVSSWEEWVKVRADLSVGAVFQKYPSPPSPEEYAARYEITYNAFVEIAEDYKKGKYPIPTDGTFSFVSRRGKYEGPQTVEAIMAALDDKYQNTFPRAAEMEAAYSRDSFLQRVLENGAVITETADYKYYMKMRDMLLYMKERPKDWQSGAFGIPVTTDFAEYEEGYLKRKVWEHQVMQHVSEANPGNSVHIYFPVSHPHVYLPSIGELTYVYRSGSLTETMGTMLTKEQRDNLVYNGIEPEGIEIVYIDEDYNVLSEAPQIWPKVVVDPKTGIASASYKGIPLTVENFESVVGHPMPAEWLEDKRTQHNDAPIPPHDPYAARREAAREAAAREVAKAEFEKFQDSMRQRKEFETMADREVSRELARQFSKQFLSKHSLKPGTSKQLENALELMFQHGFEKGFRRVRQDSPSIADQLERYLSETHRPPEPQKKPQRPTPSKSPESAPPETEAP